MSLSIKPLIGTYDVLWITLDTLRYDVAQQEFLAGRLPGFAQHLPASGWEERHSPASFTYAAHHAFFAGFLPTPIRPGPHPRLFASDFGGSQSTAPHTWVFKQATVVEALAAYGYHTLCIGGVGFFNPANALGRVLPALFQESHWQPRLGVMNPRSTEYQVALAQKCWQKTSGRLLTFINISAIHHPSHPYLPEGPPKDSLQSHAAALRYVDGALQPLWAACRARGPTVVLVCSDHGSAFGEDGHHGHRVAHPSVWTVPYAEFLL